LTEVAISSK